jgi:hypothetical protein
MSFPSSSSLTLEDALKSLRDKALSVKTTSTNIRAQSLAGGTPYSSILNYMTALRGYKAQMASLYNITGLSAYAQEQLGNGFSSINVVTEYNTMIATLDSTVQWIAANLNKDGSNYALAVQIAADGVLTERTYGSGALAGLRTQIDALLATIS